jgi:hypothetical protein
MLGFIDPFVRSLAGARRRDVPADWLRPKPTSVLPEGRGLAALDEPGGGDANGGRDDRRAGSSGRGVEGGQWHLSSQAPSPS